MFIHEDMFESSMKRHRILRVSVAVFKDELEARIARKAST